MKRNTLLDMFVILAVLIAAAFIGSIAQGAWISAIISACGLAIAAYAVILKLKITKRINENAKLLREITEGSSGFDKKIEGVPGTCLNEISEALNGLLAMIQRKEEENQRLIRIIEKGKHEWESTFDAIEDLISIHDRDYRVSRVNRALAAKFKKRPDELIGMKCHELFYNLSEPKHFCPYTTTMLTGVSATAEREDLVLDGTYKITTFPIFDESGEVTATVHVMQDITQEKLLRHQLFNAEKLTTVGKLVGGIAHELNNPLMGIMGFSQLLMDTPGDRPVSEIKEKLKKIYNESLRTARIVQNLLTFARVKRSERGYHNINDIIRQTLALREYSLKTNNIEVKLNLEEDLPSTMLDMYQMQQIIINLLSNSEDAIVSTKNPGTIEITTNSKKKRKLNIEIRDSGPGIPEEAIARVFDPFFTTKPVGKGTGLGLSIVHGIITEHGGEISVTTPDTGGTLVEIEIPIVEKEQWAEVTRSVESGQATALIQPASIEKRVLIVDDDAIARQMVSGVLAALNVKTDIARDGTEALHELDLRHYTSLIISVDMKLTNGKELYSTILEKHDYLKDRLLPIVSGAANQLDSFRLNHKAHLYKPLVQAEAARIIKDFVV